MTCWRCKKEIEETAGRCGHCGAIQPLAERDHFALFGLPRCFHLDPKDLERRYHELSRRFHPDYFQRASETEREISLANTARVNLAYRTLRDPMERTAYLVRLVGGPSEVADSAEKPPSDLFEEVLELQELMEEARGGSAEILERLAKARDRWRERDWQRLERLERMKGDWDARQDPRIIEEMKQILGQAGYFARLLADIDAALSHRDALIGRRS